MNNSPHKMINLVLLAAGQSSRFNGIKLAQPITDFNPDGLLITQPLILHSLNKLHSLSNDLSKRNIQNQVVVVLGSHLKSLLELLPSSTHVVINHASEQGLSSSIKVAVKSTIEYQAGSMLLALGDHIGIGYEDYQQLGQLWTQTELNVCAYYQQQLAAPAIFNRSCFNDLAALKTDQGAKPILYKLNKKKQLATLTLHNGIYDIDTEQDIIEWQQQFIEKPSS